MALAALFGKSKTPAEQLRQHQRSLTRAMRELDRERAKMETQEKRLIMDIKKSARAGQMGPTKTMAMDLVRTRRYIQKFYEMKTHLQGVSLKIQTIRSNQSMAEAMKGVTKAMHSMNAKIKLPQIQKIMTDFEKESEMMDMKEEMMNDAMEDAMADENDEEETDAIVSQVLDEIGINLDQSLGSAPIASTAPGQTVKTREPALAEGAGGGTLSQGGRRGSNPSSSSPTAPRGGGFSADDDDLQARLDRLRQG